MQEHLRFLNRHPGTAMSIVMINFGTMAITGNTSITFTSQISAKEKRPSVELTMFSCLHGAAKTENKETSVRPISLL